MSDWKEHRRQVLANAKRVLIKVGSAVLTSEQGLDLRVVSRLADQMSSLHDRGLDLVLVSSGAVAAGRKVISSLCLGAHLPEKQAAAAIGQSRLMHAYDEAFERFGKVTAQILLTKDDLRSRSRFLNARHTFQTLLTWRAIPIVNENDSVAVQELKFGDNDSLASLLLNMVEADLFINLTSAKGVFDDNPDDNPDAGCLECITDILTLEPAKLCRGKTGAGSGGMYSKLLAAKRAAQLGVPTLIVSGKEKFSLEKVFDGEMLGTWVVPQEKSISRRKFWMAYNQETDGELWVDAGAVKALRQGGKSLLPAGIVNVSGNFGVGALVRIMDFEGRPIGVGLSNYKAAELKRVMGRKSSEIASVLGQCPYSEAVHRDNMLLDIAG
ncbi:glutamate 5-kinase [Desulfonatronum thiosulfatophilum]|uniref:Glutamate 5-kinase n=1 Tax=Desulfonatronum thiosulfatophilum TaxID=617002 RepID=A0A1G6DNE2_9BACT|nr:glutamate 5-kinase [Desulfonatronum thiosulfatophilum]SDB46693.1 glutamate 5-kinase [Desulfonatronum thiosulfatophilum]